MNLLRLAFLAGAFAVAGVAIGQQAPMFNGTDWSSLSSYRVSNLELLNGPDGPGFKVRYNELWSNVGETFATPEDWSQYDAFAVQITNHENRWVALSVRADFALSLSNAAQSVRGIFTIAPNATSQIIVELDPKPVSMREPVPGGLPGMRLFWNTVVNKPTAFRWHVALNESTPATITALNPRIVRNSAAPTNLVDAFGQAAEYSWPGKATSNADLEAQRLAELSDLELNPPPTSVFGPAVAGAPTGRWSIQQLPNGRWSLTNFEGKQFWTFGLTTVRTSNGTPIQGRESLFQSLPPQSGNPHYYNSIVDNKLNFNFYTQNLERKYGANWDAQFPIQAMNRIRSWQFNTVSVWNDTRLYSASPIPYLLSINTEGLPWRLQAPYRDSRLLPDPYQPNFYEEIRSRLYWQIQPHNGNPNFMGFYVDGELKWANHEDPNTTYQVGLAALNAPSNQPAKLALINRMRTKYRTIARLNTAWGVNFASFNSLVTPNVLPSGRNTSSFRGDMRAFTVEYIRAYYATIRKAINDMGTTALWFGCRDHMFGPPEIVTVAGSFVDAFSVAGYGFPEKINWTFPNYNKPIILYEMTFGATDRGGWYPSTFAASDQSDRATRMTTYFQKAITSPKVLGAHWFQYKDQPVSGREGDLENISCGFVSITDQPYMEVVNAARNIGRNIYTWRNN